MVYSLCDLLICTDDTFLALFGCFCLWSCFYKLLHDLACLEELLEDFGKKTRHVFEVKFVFTISRYLLDGFGEFDA